jgi:hypothetical protein
MVVKERPSGFRVLSSAPFAIDSFPEIERRQAMHAKIISLRNKNPREIVCVALFDIKVLEGSDVLSVHPFMFGDYSRLADIQDSALIARSRHVEWIEKMNIET